MTNEIRISRKVAAFLLQYDLLHENALLYCRGYDADNCDCGDDPCRCFTALYYLDCVNEITGEIEFADHWHDFQIWLN